MKGKLFRIAHIGYYDYMDTIGILAALEHVLASVTGRPVEYGAAVRAAQEVYARLARSSRSRMVREARKWSTGSCPWAQPARRATCLPPA